MAPFLICQLLAFALGQVKASVGGAEFQRQQTAKLLLSQGTKIVIETFESPQTCTVYPVNGMYHIHCYIVFGKVSGSSAFRSTRHSRIDPFCLSLDHRRTWRSHRTFIHRKSLSYIGTHLQRMSENISLNFDLWPMRCCRHHPRSVKVGRITWSRARS
jgi:hypothetical protein